VTLDTTDTIGTVEQSFELATNDPHYPFIKLSLVAQVKPLPAFIKRIENPQIALGQQVGAFNIWPTAHPKLTLERGEKLRISFRIKPLRPDSGQLQAVSANSSELKFELKRETEHSYWLDVEIGPISEPGMYSRQIALPIGESTDLKIDLAIEVLSQNLIVTSQQLDLGEIALSDLKQRPVRVGSFGLRKVVGSFHIKAIRSTLPFLQTKTQTLVDESNYLIEVFVVPDEKMKAGVLEGVLLIEIDDLRNPKLEVPCKITFTR
jgi:hypothetical protein